MQGIHCTIKADEGPWKMGGVAGLNFAQTYLSNWQGVGNNTINGIASASMLIIKKKNGLGIINLMRPMGKH
jgi:hypothetical protein